jgi:hypothetical protein
MTAMRLCKVARLKSAASILPVNGWSVLFVIFKTIRAFSCLYPLITSRGGSMLAISTGGATFRELFEVTVNPFRPKVFTEQ